MDHPAFARVAFAFCLAVAAHAQTQGTIDLLEKGCPFNGVARVPVKVPVTIGAANFYVVRCLNIGKGLVINLATDTIEAATPPPPAATPASLPRMVKESANLNPALPAFTSTQLLILKYTPAPNTLVLAFFKSGQVGGGTVDIVTPNTATPKEIVMTVPTYRPFGAEDIVFLAYWTHDPP
jgi:hypothetical protein